MGNEASAPSLRRSRSGSGSGSTATSPAGSPTRRKSTTAPARRSRTTSLVVNPYASEIAYSLRGDAEEPPASDRPRAVAAVDSARDNSTGAAGAEPAPLTDADGPKLDEARRLEVAERVLNASYDLRLAIEGIGGAAAISGFEALTSGESSAFVSALKRIIDTVGRYPRVRLTLCEYAEEVLVYEALGLARQGDVLVAEPTARRSIMEARELLELLSAEFERDVLRQRRLLINLKDVWLAKPNQAVKSCSLMRAVGVAETMGTRPAMEDEMVVSERALFAVFDGHGGRNAAVLCASLCEEVFFDALSDKIWLEVDDRTRAAAAAMAPEERAFFALIATLHEHVVACRIRAGTTALVAHVTPDVVHVCWIGDSRAVGVLKDGSPLEMTVDHTVAASATERARLKRHGYKVSASGRLATDIAVTRSIGDVMHEEHGLLHDPEYRAFRVDDIHLCAVVLASDGLWDTVDAATAAAVVHKEGAEAAALCLRDLAVQRGSTDNVSVIVVQLARAQRD